MMKTTTNATATSNATATTTATLTHKRTHAKDASLAYWPCFR